MIEIDQIGTLLAELLLDLAHDPRCAVAHRVNVRTSPEAGADRALQHLSSGDFGPAFDRARVHRRHAPHGVRQRKLGLSPPQRFALALVRLRRVRLYDRDHAAVRLHDDRPVRAP